VNYQKDGKDTVAQKDKVEVSSYSICQLLELESQSSKIYVHRVCLEFVGVSARLWDVEKTR